MGSALWMLLAGSLVAGQTSAAPLATNLEDFFAPKRDGRRQSEEATALDVADRSSGVTRFTEQR